MKTCQLCETPVGRKGYVDGEKAFCCAGCQAVFQILQCQGATNNYANHPLFKEAIRSGLISNTELLEQLKQKQIDLPEEEFEKLHLEIQEMWCPSCAKVIHLILMKEEGIRQCVVDYSTDLASIEYAPRYLSKEKILCLIEKLGYRPVSLQDPRHKAVSSSLWLRFIIAAFCSLNIMMFAYPIYASYFYHEADGYADLFTWLSLIGTLPVLTYCAWPIWRRFFTAMRVGIWGMETLVCIGVTAALIISLYEFWRGSHYVYFDTMSVIIAFVLLGKIVESKAKFSAKDSLLKLVRGLPRRGRKRFSDGEEKFVAQKEIEIGDFIVTLTGEKIVLDGFVEEGEGACDESLITGESVPLVKRKGSTVLAGSFLQHGRLVIKVTAKLEETALHRIINTVEQDIGHKSQYTRPVDEIVKWFVPLVLALAIGVGIYCISLGVADEGYTVMQTAFVRAISVLLISCPCAIGIAAPLVESHVLNALAKKGALVRNRGCLPYMGRENVFVFDKTGTITEGKFKIVSGVEKLAQHEKMALKGLVLHSNHPIAVAINADLKCPVLEMQEVEELIGKGIRGRWNDDHYLLGSESFLHSQNITIPNDDKQRIETRVFLVKNGICLDEIILGDRIKQGVVEVVKKLAPLDVWLVSGDSREVVKHVSEKCKIDKWMAECHPLQKREFIEKLKSNGAIVTMLGDGINDAPSLTAAHVGIAVVSATDISVQVSDVLLTTDKLEIIPWLRQVSIKGHRLIRQNLFWAFFYNVVGIGLALAGVLTPLLAASAMIISSLMVLLNAQRVE